MKKMLVLMLALAALMMTAACAEDGFVFDMTEAGTYGVIEYTGPGGEVVIPDTYEGRIVNYIGPQAFQYHTGITSVVIPEGVDFIGYGAFKNCENLVSVSLPSTLGSIEEQAFANCKSLTEINMHDGIEFIGKDAFEGCDQLVLDEQEQEAYDNYGTVKRAEGEIIELSGFMNGSLEDMMAVTGSLEMFPESWGAFDGAGYGNDYVMLYTQDDETVAGIGVLSGGSYSIMGANTDMTPDEIIDVMEAQGYSVTESDEYYIEFMNGNDEQRITVDSYEGKISRIFIGWNG